MPRGGARPGSGRKGKSTIAYQTRMLALVQTTVTPEIWQAVVVKAAEQAQIGDKDARAWLTPWVLGAPPKEQEDDSAAKKVLEFIVKERNAPD